MDVLVCGGAGYIGSHMTKMLSEAGHRVVVFDNFSLSNRKDYFNPRVKLVTGNLLNEKELYLLFSRYHFDVVFHFANYSTNNRNPVSRVKEDSAYIYKNNVVGTLNLLTQMRQVHVKNIVYASSADIYQQSCQSLINESFPIVASNAFEMSVITIERMLIDFNQSYGLNSASMRFFHAEGVSADEKLHYWLELKNSELVDLIQALNITVYNKDHLSEFYGRGKADYLHVHDVCQAHLRAMEYLHDSPGAHVFNLGSNGGYSIHDIFDTARRIFHIEQEDPFQVENNDQTDKTLSGEKCKKHLGWQAKVSLVETMSSIYQLIGKQGLDKMQSESSVQSKDFRTIVRTKDVVQIGKSSSPYAVKSATWQKNKSLPESSDYNKLH